MTYRTQHTIQLINILGKYLFVKYFLIKCKVSKVAQTVNNLPETQYAGDLGLISGSGRFPGGGHGSPLQDSYLENSMDRGAWWATVYDVAKSWTLLRDFHFFVFKMSNRRSRMCMVNTCFFTVMSLLSFMCVCVCVCVFPPCCSIDLKEKSNIIPSSSLSFYLFVPLGSRCAHIWDEGQFRCWNSFVY